MRARLLTLAAAAGIAVVALPATAGGSHGMVNKDPAGDANGLNDQGLGGFLVVPEQRDHTTPVADDAADITAVTFRSTFVTKKVQGKKRRVSTGFDVTMSLAAAPDPATYYQVTATVPSCSTGDLQLSYASNAVNEIGGGICPNGISGADVPGVTTRATGNGIVWHVPATAAKPGATISRIRAFTFTNTPVFLAWALDTGAWDSTFTVGK